MERSKEISRPNEAEFEAMKRGFYEASDWMLHQIKQSSRARPLMIPIWSNFLPIDLRRAGEG
jgi:hypothetical protein